MRLTFLMFLLPVLTSCATRDVAVADAGTEPQRAAEPSVEQLVAARRAGMHMAATLLYQGIKKAVRRGTDVKAQSHDLDGIALWGAAIPGLFPAGSMSPQSRAKAAIWENKADFDQKAADLQQAALRLLELSKAGDKAGFAQQADVVQARCNACHVRYRSE